MKVILNVDAISAPLTGIGRYALELARGLERHAAIDALRLYSAYRWVDDPAEALAVNRHIASVRRRVPFAGVALEVYAAARSALFRYHARGLADHVLHAPNYLLMPFDGPAVCTVHDLSWVSYPEAHPPERVRFLNRHLPRTLERADAVLTDSEFIAGELMSRLGVARTKLRVVPLGVDAVYRPLPADDLVSVLTRHGLRADGYLLVVATQEPRKNLARLVRAYSALPPHLQSRWPLAIVGMRGWLNSDLERTLAPLEARGAVRRLGYVEEADLPAVYAGARGFAFPSLYEGFGLPVLEAMASGVPVLTSSVSSLPEVAGDAALCVDPFDEDALREGLAHLLEDEAWRSDAMQRGLERARAHPWSRCVDATVDVYREVSRA